jgi:DNA processing protein
MTHCGPPLSADDAIYASALASLGVSPGRLRRILADRTPTEAWEAIAAGDHPADAEGRLRPMATAGALGRAARCADPAITVWVHGRPGYPEDLAGDIEPPAVLFARGRPDACRTRPRVAVVGTRSATPSGRAFAEELGRSLADSGVVVVSGLARGIDAAAHRGALASPRAVPPLGVLGTAIDAAIARDQAALRDEVAARGLLLSELPPGVAGARWWFAVRNRVMAALAQVVVVVECHTNGGALHTVVAAKRRGTPVAAVPGSVRSPAAAGSNALLVQGAAAVRDAGDVLGLLMEAHASLPGIPPSGQRPGGTARTPSRPRRRVPSPLAARVRRALDHEPVTLDAVVGRCGLPIGEVALALEQLSDAGMAISTHGWWSLPDR